MLSLLLSENAADKPSALSILQRIWYAAGRKQSWERAQKVITQSPVARRRVCVYACVCLHTHVFIVHIYMCKV